MNMNSHQSASVSYYDRRLREQLDEAREEIRQLKQQLREALTGSPGLPYPELHLSKSERFYLEMIVNCRGISVTSRMFDAWQFVRIRNGNREPELLKSVSVLICRLRKKLAKFGIVISTAWGTGFYLTGENRARLADLSGLSEEPATRKRRSA
jgi:hypothetical protein